MNLLNGSCNHCIYGDGKLITYNKCEGMLRGGFCLPCNLREENSFICYQNAYSFNDTSNNSNPQPQYENYLCNLCGNNSHDGYDCQQQFPLVYKQEPSYNQNYDDNYYPHESPSFPCCDNRGGSHETFQCQPMDQNIDFSGSDQIQTPQYPEIHPPSQEISDEVFQANHFVQYKEYSENSSNEIAASNSNQEKEGPPQDSDIRQLIREECGIEVCEEQKQNIENTILKLVEICRQKMLLCMHDNVGDLIESALNSKLLSINFQRLDKEKQEVKNVVEQPAERRTRIEKSLQNFKVIHKSSISLKNTSQISPVHVVAPILSTKEPEYSPSMGYENPNTTAETELDEIIKSGVEELVPIPSKNEVTLENKREYIEYVEASLHDPEIASLEEENTRSGNTTTHADVSLPEYDSFCFEIEPDQERLINVLKNEISDDSSNDPLLEEADLFLASDNSIPPGNENFTYDLEGDIRFLEALPSDDSIPFSNNELSESNFDNPSFPRPPPEPPDAKFDFELDAEILIVMNDSDELECLDPRDDFNFSNDENDDYSSFMFVIYPKVFSFLLSAESEDMIFDHGFTPHRLKFLVFDCIVPVRKNFTSFL
nr:hypothetical protein [Tanacetum cinerariifolium]